MTLANPVVQLVQEQIKGQFGDIYSHYEGAEMITYRKRQQIPLNPGYATYLRTSSAQAQAPERSQSAQRRRIYEQFGKDSAIPLFQEYTDDFTGTSSQRPGLLALLATAKAGRFSHLYIAMADRWGRYDVQDLQVIDELTNLGISIRFASHPHLDPANPNDRFQLLIQLGLSTVENKIRAAKTLDGMMEKLYAGGWSWGAPEGYSNIEERIHAGLSDEDRRQNARYKRSIEVNEPFFSTVRSIFDLLLDGWTYAEICREMPNRGNHKLSTGRLFVTYKGGQEILATSTIERIAHNWFYAGWIVLDTDCFEIQPKTLRGNWTPVLSTEEFERVQEIIGAKNSNRKIKAHHFYLLHNLLQMCRADGSMINMQVEAPTGRNGTVKYYRSGAGKGQIRFQCAGIDNQVIELISLFQVKPELREDLLLAYQRNIHLYSKLEKSGRESLREQIKRIESQIERNQNLYLDGDLEAKRWKQIDQNLQSKLAQKQAEYDSLTDEVGAQIQKLDDAFEILKEVNTLYHHLHEKQKQEIIQLIFKSIVINHQGEILPHKCELQLPFEFLNSLREELTDNITGS